MSETCLHPVEALEHDRTRGQTTCSLCGTVVAHATFEMDSTFAHGSTVTRAAGGTGPGAIRGAPGYTRPPRARAAQHGAHGASRPSVESARRQMTALARKMGLPTSVIDTATVVYRQAVAANAIVGARMSVLCACLYLVCRKQRLPQTVLDFCDQSQEPPWAILNYVRTICGVTHIDVPPADASFYVARFTEALDLKELSHDVTICALKVLRAMKNDWISTGRRPLGICAAAVIVACKYYGIERRMEDFARLSRLTEDTICFHIEEFNATPAAALPSIDDYRPSESVSSVPSCYSVGRAKDSKQRDSLARVNLEADFYTLVEEARAGTPITATRVELWRRFVSGRAEAAKMEPDPNTLDIRKLSVKQQLEILGVPVKAERAASTSQAPVVADSAATLPEPQIDHTLVQEAERLAPGIQMSLSSRPLIFDDSSHATGMGNWSAAGGAAGGDTTSSAQLQQDAAVVEL